MADWDVIVIGAAGLAGSAIRRHFESEGRRVLAVTRDNYPAHLGASAELVVNANGNPYRFKANDRPVWDFEAAVASVQRSLHDFRAGRYVYLSTVDVYQPRDNPAVTEETVEPAPGALDAYGFHRRLAERCVRQFAPSSLVLRLGTLVGSGVRKGPFHDLLRGEPLRMSPASSLTVVNAAQLGGVIAALHGVAPVHDVFNVTGRGGAVVAQVAARAGLAWTADPAWADRAFRYDINIDKLARHCALPSSEDAALAFLNEARQLT
jgi:nucleoside-diphosphate-sugar epimerase